MKPNLKLAVNVQTDIENAQWFVKTSEFVSWFLPQNFQYILSKKFSILEKNKIIAEYTKQIYKLNKKDILKGVSETKKLWAKIENKFYSLTNTIFKGHPWPKGQYFGYTSIYFMFPRNVEKKFFYFPFSKNKFNPVRVIAHEMLHFIFFDYIKRNYGLNENKKLPGKNPKYIWQVSETFNNVIENWPPYKNIISTKEKSRPYPGCEKMFKLMTQQWAKNQDIKNFLDKWLL
ncbi:MAG: hypothetical protein NTV81_02275 [Candidatus Komeilibacteria bacterium]|nr:hypothetical protein [Candidatus Komeilibacteria bacterium]